jgi:hypothetical protein
MAEVRIQDDQIRLILTTAEKLEGVHPDLKAPVATINGVEVLDDAHRAAGFRAGIKVGTRLPGIVEVGRVVGLHAQRFVAVHHDTPRGVRIRFDGASGFDEWIVGSEDPEALATQIDAVRPQASPPQASPPQAS